MRACKARPSSRMRKVSAATATGAVDDHRRFAFDRDAGYAALISQVSGVYAAAVTSLQWTDSDGDLITIGSDSELEEAFRNAEKSNRIKLQAVLGAANPIDAPWVEVESESRDDIAKSSAPAAKEDRGNCEHSEESKSEGSTDASPLSAAEVDGREPQDPEDTDASPPSTAEVDGREPPDPEDAARVGGPPEEPQPPSATADTDPNTSDPLNLVQTAFMQLVDAGNKFAEHMQAEYAAQQAAEAATRSSEVQHLGDTVQELFVAAGDRAKKLLDEAIEDDVRGLGSTLHQLKVLGCQLTGQVHAAIRPHIRFNAHHRRGCRPSRCGQPATACSGSSRCNQPTTPCSTRWEVPEPGFGYGSAGPHVEQLQKTLIYLGLMQPSAIRWRSGLYGPHTCHAIATINGDGNGEYNVDTRAKLLEMIGAQSADEQTEPDHEGSGSKSDEPEPEPIPTPEPESNPEPEPEPESRSPFEDQVRVLQAMGFVDPRAADLLVKHSGSIERVVADLLAPINP